MSNNFDPSSNPLNIETIQEIDNLDLPIMQRHHVRILAHCLQILKTITDNDNKTSKSFDKDRLREWSENQSKKFNDKKFSDLFYDQLESTAKKLNFFAQTKGKNIDDLEIDDLVVLVKES